MTQSSNYQEKNPFEAVFEFAKKSDKKQQEVAVAIGLVVIKWNTIHDILYHIFVEITELNTKVAYAIWSSVINDRAQRVLLKAAANEVYVKPNQLQAKNNLNKLIRKIDKAATLRNRFIHCSYTPSFRDNDIKYIANDLSGNKHAKILKNKDLLAEIPKFSDKLDDLIKNSGKVFYYVCSAAQDSH